MTDETPDVRFAKLADETPPPQEPVGMYKPMVRSGINIYSSGHGPMLKDSSLITGRIGEGDFDVAHGQNAARQVAIAILSSLQHFNGTLNNIRVVKVLGMVLCTDEFAEHPKVVNGCSQVFADVFGNDLGIGARSAVAMSSLPGKEIQPGSPQISVEVEVIFEVIDD